MLLYTNLLKSEPAKSQLLDVQFGRRVQPSIQSVWSIRSTIPIIQPLQQ
jgi:hypothetical protein